MYIISYYIILHTSWVYHVVYIYVYVYINTCVRSIDTRKSLNFIIMRTSGRSGGDGGGGVDGDGGVDDDNSDDGCGDHDGDHG